MSHIEEIASQAVDSVFSKPQYRSAPEGLADEMKRVLAVWIDYAAQENRNADFYRGLIDQCAAVLGPEAYTADDGIVHEDPVRLKVPTLVANLVSNLDRVRSE